MTQQLFVLVCVFIVCTVAVRLPQYQVEKSPIYVGNYQTLPGIDAMGVGFDLVKGQSNFVPVVAFTYNQENLYQNPYNTSLVYVYPDQTAVADYNSYDVVSMTFSSASEYSDYLAENAGVDVHFGAAFSLSAQWSYVSDVTETQGNTYSQTQQLFTLYQVELLPPQYLSQASIFKLAVSRLPSQYNEATYAQFVQYFGTHYVSQALYGGRAMLKTNIQKEYADSNSPFVMSGNAKLYFSNLKNGGGGSYSYPQPSADFLNNSATETELIGGNPFIPLSQWGAWIDSIKQAPAQVSYRLAPITKLIPDPTIQANLNTYINAYYAANTHTPPPPKPSYISLGPCDCYSPGYNSYNGCENGYFILGSEEDGNGGPIAPPLCCTPCYSFGAIGSFSSNATQLAVQTWEAMNIRKEAMKEREAALNERKALQKNVPGPNLCGTNPCLPGLSSMAIGMDAITGRLKSQPIVAWSYKLGNIWTNPFTGENYAYPDQVSVVDDSAHDIEVYTFDSITQYGTYLAEKAGISGSIGSFFSGSLDVVSISNIFNDDLAILGLTTQLATIYEVTLAPPFLLTLSDVFTQMIEDLPETYDEQAYQNFVDYFGTHLVSQALYGGEAVMKTAIDQHYFGMYDQSYIQAKIGFQYEAFQLGINFWRNHTQSFGEFLNSSWSECHLLGGNYEDFNINDWDKWVESIEANPLQVRYQLTDITTFVSDPQKAANLGQYISTYIAANNHTAPPVKVFPPMTSCDEHTADYLTENCNQTHQLTSSFQNLYIDNGTPYFQLPQNCGSPCYPGNGMPEVSLCGCYTEQQGVSFCTRIGYFVAGYANSVNNYPALPPVCCAPCYEVTPSDQL